MQDHVDVALGKLIRHQRSAKKTCSGGQSTARITMKTIKRKTRRLRELCAKLAEDDRTGLARLLHEWEAYTVKNFKIEHLWEPTPFPLEMVG